MVRKISKIAIMLGLIGAILCAPVQAYSHTVYENGSLSTTYITYFKDILAGTELKHNYVAFRSGQYSYSLVVGDLENNNGIISLVGEGKEYKFYTTSTGYNSQYLYDVITLNDFSVDTENYIIYSDVGDYPELIERGSKYEIITTILLCIALLSIVFGRFFRRR